MSKRIGKKSDDEYKARKLRGQQEQARRTPYNFKMRNGGAKYEKNIQSRMLQKGASREVMVKITGSANRPRGVKNEINYIAREGEITLRDNNGVEYHIADREQRKEAYESLIDDEDKKQYTHDRSPNLVHNMVFSSPKIAEVPEKDIFKAVEETLKQKYPENRFLMAYHTDKEHHPHVHALLRIPDNGGKRINIRKKDLRELREKFAGNLQKMGYKVKCTHKYEFGKKEQLKREPDRLRNLFEVVEFGRTNYLFDPKNKQQNYITLRTLKNKTEMTRWGSNIADEIKREGVKVGSVIKMRKEGETTVKVPLTDGQGNKQGWSDHKRNNWRIENQGAMGIKPAPFDKLKPLDTPEQLLKQQRGFSLFKQNQEATVKLQQQQKLGIRVGIFKF
ncbi:MobP1 family relaxase [Arsenophonus nasoniae]|uniref:MobP1 family relaxase n=1 Tax=Arsenophonus nasoniae TaxID=638 RepID=A0ABY8NWJ1_9GAMM|nr:MobP1 family relaxase [Arsenophonus nasoniae]WGM08715.1 MobP1 family relaxase [Arsenophonus nasoniae]